MAYVQWFDLCKIASVGSNELHIIIFQKLQSMPVHEEELPSVVAIMVAEGMINVAKIQVVSAPQRTRGKREVAHLCYFPAS